MSLSTLDVNARAICRVRGVCEAAGNDGVQCKGSLQWAHIVSRTYHRVRWDEDNCLLLCAAHHFFYGLRHLEWEDFLDRRIGRAKYEELKLRARSGPKTDRLAVYERLLARQAELGSPDIATHAARVD